MDEIDLKELLFYFLSKYLIIIFVILSVFAIGNLYSWFLKVPKYKSTTKLVLVSENGETTSSDVSLNNNLVNTYAELIKGRSVVETVINNLDLKETVGSLTKKISVSTATSTTIISVSVTEDNAELAQKIADELASVFVKEVERIFGLKNIYIVDKASYSSSPSNMNFVKDNLIYLFIGIAVSVIIVFVIYLFDSTISNSKEIEDKLGLVVLGDVPKVVKDNE